MSREIKVGGWRSVRQPDDGRSEFLVQSPESGVQSREFKVGSRDGGFETTDFELLTFDYEL